MEGISGGVEGVKRGLRGDAKGVCSRVLVRFRVCLIIYLLLLACLLVIPGDLGVNPRFTLSSSLISR